MGAVSDHLRFHLINERAFCLCFQGIRPTYSNNIIKVAVPDPVPGPTSGSGGRYALVNLLSKVQCVMLYGVESVASSCFEHKVAILFKVWLYAIHRA